MKRGMLVALVSLLCVGSVNAATTLTIGIYPGTAPYNYEIRGVLSGDANQGLALWGVDATWTVGAIDGQLAAPSPGMDNFVVTAGLNNPAGYGGTLSGSSYLQIGGGQNTINNNVGNAPYPIGAVNASVGVPYGTVVVLAKGIATEGDTICLSNPFGNVIKAGETGPVWAVLAATAVIAAAPNNCYTIPLLANYTLASAKSWKNHGAAPGTPFYVALPIVSSGSTSPGVETRVGGITQLEIVFTGTPSPLPAAATGYLKQQVTGTTYNPTSKTINGLVLTLNFTGIPNAKRYVCCLSVAGLTGDSDVEVIGQVGNIAQAPPTTKWTTDATDLGAIGPFIGQTTTQANCKYDITQAPPTSRMKIDSSDKTTLAGSYSPSVQTTPVTCP